jgi:hypothetical protein
MKRMDLQLASGFRISGIVDEVHGLKKGGMRRLAEDGNTAHELLAISGHKTLSMVEPYTRDADRKILADRGMAKKRTEANTKGDSPGTRAHERDWG